MNPMEGRPEHFLDASMALKSTEKVFAPELTSTKMEKGMDILTVAAAAAGAVLCLAGQPEIGMVFIYAAMGLIGGRAIGEIIN